MAKEKIGRLGYCLVTFYPDDIVASGGLPIGYNQNVTLTRSSEKKELYSNDDSIEATAIELDTKATYELAIETGDLNIDNLAVAFKGAITQKTYAAGETFPTGKVIKANIAEGNIGDLILNAGGDKIHIVTETFTAGNFDAAKTAAKTYNATVNKLSPEAKKTNFGKIVCDGVNAATGKPQILVVERINLGFDGDFTVSGNDFSKLSLKGKCLKTSTKPEFEFFDA